MYTEHPCFVQPDNKEIKIWRDINFTKLVSMLVSGSLYFTRSDRFDDPFEGSYPKQNVNLLYRSLEASPSGERDEAVRFIPQLRRARVDARKRICINCWQWLIHLNPQMRCSHKMLRTGVIEFR